MVLEQVVKDSIDRDGCAKLPCVIPNDYLESITDGPSNESDSQVRRLE